jgi:hypothetical protein
MSDAAIAERLRATIEYVIPQSGVVATKLRALAVEVDAAETLIEAQHATMGRMHCAGCGCYFTTEIGGCNSCIHLREIVRTALAAYDTYKGKEQDDG